MKNCLKCGVSFTPMRNCPGRYCSQACTRTRDKSGNKNPKWRGGIKHRKDGRRFIYSPDHPGANARGYVLEYRLIAERMLGRFLRSDEIVHHINHIPTDNRPENLAVMSSADHARAHAAGRRNPQNGRFI